MMQLPQKPSQSVSGPKTQKSLTIDSETHALLLGLGGSFTPYTGETLTKPENSCRFIGWQKTEQGTKLVFQKSPDAKGWFDMDNDRNFGGDITWPVNILGGIENAKFWGFEYVGDSLFVVPGADVVNNAIDIYNNQIALTPADRIGISFYIPYVDRVPNDQYARDYTEKGILPLANVSMNTNPNLREAMHDISYHFSSILLPARLHELVRKRLQIITNFLLSVPKELNDHFTITQTRLGVNEETISWIRENIIRSIENMTALVSLYRNPHMPKELKPFGKEKELPVCIFLRFFAEPLCELYPKSIDVIISKYKVLEDLDFVAPDYIEKCIAPFCNAFHAYIQERATCDQNTAYKTIYQELGIVGPEQLVPIIDESISRKNTLVTEYLKKNRK